MFVSQIAAVMAGGIVLHGANIYTNANIGIGRVISIEALIDNNAVVEDFSHINTAVIFGKGRRADEKVDADMLI